jgi:hypothetical protein
VRAVEIVFGVCWPAFRLCWIVAAFSGYRRSTKMLVPFVL